MGFIKTLIESLLAVLFHASQEESGSRVFHMAFCVNEARKLGRLGLALIFLPMDYGYSHEKSVL
jgi:hypothetical protein